MSKDFIFTLILGITWIIGFFGSFVLSYIITKHDQKENPDKQYTYADVFTTQDSIGGPLVIIPIFNIVWLLFCIYVYNFPYKNKHIFKFLDKEI